MLRGLSFPLLPFFLLLALAGPAAADPPSSPADEIAKLTDLQKVDDAAKLKADTAWMLMSCGLVLLMIPGLALFYAGMVRRKNVLGTMMHSMAALAIVGVQWVLFGYSLAFGESRGGWIGFSDIYLGLEGVKPSQTFPGSSVPIYVHCMFQGMFAIITPALISGALAERIRFGPYCLFVLVWTTVVYDPLAHWVWALDGKGDAAGWLGKMGALDFAGGTVVHIAAGFSALAAILLLPKRRGYPEHPIHPNSMVLTLLGAGLLWFGWFGFNGGSALSSGPWAGLALTASQAAAAAAALSWVAAEWLHRGKPTALGLASGVVAGLVAVTPASGYVSPLAALAIGLIAGAACYFAVVSKPALKYDDSLDAFGVHGVGGVIGAVLTGVFASFVLWNDAAGNSPAKDLGKLTAEGGRASQLVVQLIAAAVAAGYAFVATAVIVKVIDVLWGFALPAEAESVGLDRAEHGEVGFDFGLASEGVPETRLSEPKAAKAPPQRQERFAVVIENVEPRELMEHWSKLCQVNGAPPPPDFRAVYPFVTTVKGNRFHFRGGDRQKMRGHLMRLFADKISGTVRAHVEE